MEINKTYFVNYFFFYYYLTYNIDKFGKREVIVMSKYAVKLSEEDLQMIKDCHSKNPSIMKAMNEAKKED